MTETTNFGWPWGDNRPTRPRRLWLSIAVAFIYGLLLHFGHRVTDFDHQLLSSRLMLQGRNPYALIGPGLEFHLDYKQVYPATTFVAITPLLLLSTHFAAVVFVGLSMFVLSFGITRDSWHRIPILFSAPIFDAVFSAQWTLLLTAMLLLPWISALAFVKPQSGIPPLARSGWKGIGVSVIGASVLGMISLFFLPHWPRDWIANVSEAHQMKVPALSVVGLFLPLLLFKWRTWEARVIILWAILPQAFMWYNAVVLLAIAGTYREALFLALVSTLGVVVAASLNANGAGFNLTWATYLMTTLLPAIAVVFLRPRPTNE